jgi:broad specificity phosphatase PhoE
MRTRRTSLFRGLLALLICSFAASALAADDAVERLRDGGVLLLRHAIAPGFGDPDGFRVDDCATQRNLDDTGRRQAAAIGAWLRDRGIRSARVYSSQWCRCLDTARLLGLGDVTQLPALNSFFQRREQRADRLAALRAFLARQPRRGEPLVLVTHQVTVTAMTGMFADSGDGVVATLGADGALSDFVRLDFDD